VGALEQIGTRFDADPWLPQSVRIFPDVLADRALVSRSEVLALGAQCRQTGTEKAARELLVASCI